MATPDSDKPITVTAQIRRMLGNPDFASLTNGEIARGIGCEPSTVRKVRAELETMMLREENLLLRDEIKALEAKLAKPRPRKPRVKNDSRPMFERVDAETGEVVAIVGMI